MNFVILNSYVKVIYLRFIKNTYFYAVKNKIWKQLYWFFPNKKNYKMKIVYISKSVKKYNSITW